MQEKNMGHICPIGRSGVKFGLNIGYMSERCDFFIILIAISKFMQLTTLLQIDL